MCRPVTTINFFVFCIYPFNNQKNVFKQYSLLSQYGGIFSSWKVAFWAPFPSGLVFLNPYYPKIFFIIIFFDKLSFKIFFPRYHLQSSSFHLKEYFVRIFELGFGGFIIKFITLR